jgi:hypothetical protein
VRRVHVKVLERDVVVRVRSLEQSLKDHKVVPRHEPALRDVRDAKEGGELRTADARQVALGRDSIDELFTVQKPGREQTNDEVREQENGQEELRTFHRRRGILRSRQRSAASASSLTLVRAPHS